MGFWAVAIPIITSYLSASAAKKGAEEQRKAAESASKGQTTTATSVPYMNEYISKLIPYILSEQQKIYENRLKGYGMKPGDFSPIAQLLAGIPQNYSGVGGNFSGAGGSPFFGSAQSAQDAQLNQMNALSPEERAKLEDYAKQQGISNREASMILYGPDRLDRSPGTRFSSEDDAERLYQESVYSGVRAGDAKAAGDRLLRALKGGKGGDTNWLLRMLLGGFGGGGGGGGAKISGEGGSSLFGMGEWSAGKAPSM